MKHKKLLIVLAVIVVMGIAAAAAYAWWSSDAEIPGNSITTGGLELIETVGLPFTAEGLVPQNPPDADAPDADYAHVSYFYLHNPDDNPALMFYGWLSDGDDSKGLRDYVRARIWVLGTDPAPDWWNGIDQSWVGTFGSPGGPYVSFDGKLADLWPGRPAGINYLSSRYGGDPTWGRTLFDPGEYAVYRMAIWLDGSAPDSTQHSTVSFTINWTGMQVGAWDAAGYDDTPKY